MHKIKSYCESIKLQVKSWLHLTPNLTYYPIKLFLIEKNKSLKSRIEQLESKLSSIDRSQSITHSISKENLFSKFMDQQSKVYNIILFYDGTKSTK